MDNKENSGSVKYLIEKLRYITLAVQIAPFIYTVLYIICLILYLFCPEPIIMVLDTLFYVSPTTVLMMLVASKILKLCAWHRTACVLPVLPQVFVFTDHFIVELSTSAFYIVIITPVALAILLLIAAYHVFIK